MRLVVGFFSSYIWYQNQVRIVIRLANNDGKVKEIYICDVNT